jgi:hypothetical protein
MEIYCSVMRILYRRPRVSGNAEYLDGVYAKIMGGGSRGWPGVAKGRKYSNAS